MAISKVIVAPHAKEVSLKNGTTETAFDAGIALAEKVVRENREAWVKIIEQTQHSLYRPWLRIRGPKSDHRVVIENTGTAIVVHAVLYKDDHTYNMAESLWKQHRSK
jgi:5-formyltetrahydrofolate cyclo-ligase